MTHQHLSRSPPSSSRRSARSWTPSASASSPTSARRTRRTSARSSRRQRGFEVAGRALFYLPPAWPLAVAALSVSKILDNMEIGHNVMHGQYDWMGDPGLNSRMYEWDNVCPSDQWKYSHNYIHHTFTNILGKDRDIGYGILRMDEDQKWHPYYLGNPVYAFLLMVFFEWGVAMHDLEVENIVKGTRKLEENKAAARRAHAQGPAPGAQGLRAVPRADRPAVPADPRRQRGGQPGPQRLGVQHHLLRPLPGRRRDVLRGGVRGRVPRPLVLPPAARLGQHHRRQAVPPDDRQPVATRSSTTSSRTCRPAATRRSPSRCARSASATAWPTTPARSASSCSAWPGRSAGWRCRTASRAPTTPDGGCDRARVGGVTRDGVTLMT